MLNQFYTGSPNTMNPDLQQYCMLENVLPSALVRADKPKKTMKLQLEKTAFRLLKRIDKWLHAVIYRLTADIEHRSMAQRYLS